VEKLIDRSEGGGLISEEKPKREGGDKSGRLLQGVGNELP